jgi:hypothetical protein
VSRHGDTTAPATDPSLVNTALHADSRRSGAAAGIDLNSDELIELSEHANCLGAKVSAAATDRL